MFAELKPVTAGTTYTRYFIVGVAGGEYEVQVRAFKKATDSAYDDDYKYVFCLPETGSIVNTNPMTSTDVNLYKSAKYVFDFYIGRKIGGLAKTIIKSIPDTVVGYVTAIADPLGKNHLRLTSWPEPQVNDYFSYQLRFVRVRTVGTVRWQDYDSTTNLWRKNSNGVYQIERTNSESYSYPLFRDEDRYQ